jgi:hypothetical protein
MDIKFAPAGVMPEEPEKIARRSAKRRIQVERAATLLNRVGSTARPRSTFFLMQLFEDHVFARRMMIENRVLDRTPNGSSYWAIETN